MEFFLDTANVDTVERLLKTGMVDGVTTNPTLIARENRPWKDIVADLCTIVDGPISVEVSALDYDNMIEEGRYLSSLSEKIAVKVPLTQAGLRVCKELSDEDLMVNVTLCFSPLQALLAAKAGATFVSPFIGRLDDIGQEGNDLIVQIKKIYEQYSSQLQTLVLAASIRTPQHVLLAAKAGAEVITMPPSILELLYRHPLTDKGIDTFTQDWKMSGQKIL